MSDDFAFTPSRSSALPKPLLQTACKIISQADRAHPADTLLRETFKRLRVFNADETRAISEAVFTYFRWRGFLDAADNIHAQVDQAFHLAAQFEQDPFSLTDADLRAKTVPGWIASEVEAATEWFRALQRPPNLWLRAKRGQGIALSYKLNSEPRLLPDALVYADNMPANSSFRTSAPKPSASSAPRNPAKPGGTPARAKAASSCIFPTSWRTKD
jgi:hypothetical protein